MASGKKRILIIDDEKIVRAVVSRVAADCDAEVVLASNGAEGAKRMHEPGTFDLIVVDLIMPDATGWDVIDFVEKSTVHKDTPVIVLTGTKISESEKRKLLKRVNAVTNKDEFTVDRFRFLIESCSVLQHK
jgi:CheY-like chemotaxis protein